MPLVHSIRRSGRLAIAAMVLAVLVGCSGNTTEVFFREHVVSPGVGSVAIAIYEVGDAGGDYLRVDSPPALLPASEKIKRDFRRRLVEGLRRSKAFTEILDPPPALLPAPALVVSAKIAVKYTSGFLNYQNMRGIFPSVVRERHINYAVVELRDSKEVVLAKFEIWGEGEIVFEWCSLAKKIARAIARWSRGEGLTGNDAESETCIGDNPIIGERTEIGDGTTIGNNFEAGKDVDIRKDVDIGNDTSVGDDSTIRDGSSLGDMVEVGDDVTIFSGVIIGDRVTIGVGASIKAGALIWNDAVIGTGATIGRNATISAGATVPPNAKIKNGARFP